MEKYTFTICYWGTLKSRVLYPSARINYLLPRRLRQRRCQSLLTHWLCCWYLSLLEIIWFQHNRGHRLMRGNSSNQAGYCPKMMDYFLAAQHHQYKCPYTLFGSTCFFAGSAAGAPIHADTALLSLSAPLST